MSFLEKLKRPKPQKPKRDEAAEEDMAMETFRRRISQNRESINPYGVNRAPGWDYIHWKPYGWHRYAYNPDDFTNTCKALVPYVQCVLESAAEGSKETRWETLAGQGSLHSRTLEGSRLTLDGSRASLTAVGRR